MGLSDLQGPFSPCDIFGINKNERPEAEVLFNPLSFFNDPCLIREGGLLCRLGRTKIITLTSSYEDHYDDDCCNQFFISYCLYSLRLFSFSAMWRSMMAYILGIRTEEL